MSADPWDDDDRIGVPRAGAARPPVLDEPPPTLTAREPADDFAEPELRPGETGLGRPPQVPREVRPLTDDDRTRLRQADEAQALQDLAEDNVLAIQPRGDRGSDKELGAVGVFAGIGHA